MATAEQIATQPQVAVQAARVPAIAVNDLHKSFGSQTVLNGISLTVRRGETLAVLGRSGDGAVRKAVERILKGLKGRKFNSLEITKVVSKRFLGVPYVKVFAHSRHIQEGVYLAPARDSFLKTSADATAEDFGPGKSEQELQSDTAAKHATAAVLSS